MVKASARIGSIGFSVNVANALAAIYTATGQDIACLVESTSVDLILEPLPGNYYLIIITYHHHHHHYHHQYHHYHYYYCYHYCKMVESMLAWCCLVWLLVLWVEVLD